jgi:GDSL-like Lipase/Acylhydrolase family
MALVALLVTLATGCQYVGTTGPRVSFHGDSMGWQADQQITHRLTRDHRLFRFSRERAVTADMIPVVRQLMQNVRKPQIVIVELGAGDANNFHGDQRMRRDIRRMLDLVRTVPCVQWLSLKIAGVNGYYQGYRQRADDFNRILARQAADYPNTRVAPYRQWANANPGAFKADGLHHTEQGKTRYAQFIEGVADNCGI